MRRRIVKTCIIVGIVMLLCEAGVVSSTYSDGMNNHKNEIIQTLEQGLIGYWNCNEGSGSTAHDTSGYGNNGMIVNASWVDGISGTALEITDQGYVKNISSSFDDPISSAFTVAAWIKWYGPSSYPDHCIIFDGRSQDLIAPGFLFFIHHESHQLVLRLDDTTVLPWIRSISPIPIGQWTHVVAMFDDTINICRMYINGHLDNITIVTVPYKHSTDQAMIGNNHWALGDNHWAPFNGIEDEIRLYNKALNEVEILELYNIFELDIQGGFGVKLVIKNNGLVDTDSIEWQIRVHGGILGMINKTVSGTINISAGASETVTTRMLLGFGDISIVVNVADKEQTATGKQIIIFSTVT